MPRNENKKSRGTNGTGSIRKVVRTKNGKKYTFWEGRYTAGYDPGTGKQIQRSISGKSQKEVAQRLRQITSEIDQGTYQEPCHMTVREWLEIWKAEYTGDVKEDTAYLYRKNLDSYIIPRLGAVKLEQLTAPMIQAVYNDLVHPSKDETRPLSPKTVRNVHGVFRKALKQAVLVGYIRTNPANACKPPRVTKKEVTPLDETTLAEFLKAIQGHPHEYLYQIAVFTGLREGELLGLTWDCIDFERGILLVKQQLRRHQQKGGTYYLAETKNGRSRMIVLASSVLRLFRLQKIKQNGQRAKAGDRWTENHMVFTNETGGFLSYRTVYDCFKRLVKKIGAPSTRFHDLRHTYAVLAIKSGDDIKTVQENLGHATAAFTLDVYGHVTPQMKKESAERMEHIIQSVSAS